MTKRYKVIDTEMDWAGGARVGDDRTVVLSDEAAQYDLARGKIEPVESAVSEPEAPAPMAKKAREG